MEKTQRKYCLDNQTEAFQKELGDGGPISELRVRSTFDCLRVQGMGWASWWYSQLWRPRGLTSVVVAMVIFAFTLPGALTLQAAQDAPRVRHIVVTLNKSRTITFPEPINTATIASTAIADIKPMTDRSLYIQGKAPGTTNISLFDDNMQLVEVLDLEVTIDTMYLQEKIRASTRNNTIRVSSSNGQVILTGMASDAVAADRAVSLAKSLVKAGDIVNAMTVAPSQQVMLKVRFLEASRQAERDLGVNWFGTNASGTRGFSTGLGTP